MALTYADAGQLARTDEFLRRVQIAMKNAAAAVYSEVNTTPGHAARAAFATKVENGNYSLSDAALAVGADPTILANGVLATTPGNAITDAQIQNAINAVWNCLAGA